MAKTKVSDARLVALAAKKTRQEIALITGLHYDTVRKRLKKLGVEPKTDANKQVVTSESVRADIATLVAKQRATQNAKKLRVIAKELVRAEKELEALKGVKGVETHSIKGSKSFNKSEATAILLASDWHYEENVKLSQTNGLNEFNRTIAKERIEKLFKVVAKLIEVHQKEYNIDNFVLALMGDFISGSIHDDLKEGNEIQPTQAIYEVQCLIASGIEYMLKNSNVNLIIPCSSGNHGRITDKIRVSTAYGNSLEFLMYRTLRDYFKNEKRVKFIINDSYLTYMDIYDYKIRFHHGDAMRYGGGIGGLFIPAFKAISQWDKQIRADWTFFGHFHQLKDGGNFVSNGSLIGFSPYAIRIKADYEKPKQAFLILDKERGLEVTRKITL